MKLSIKELNKLIKETVLEEKRKILREKKNEYSLKSIFEDAKPDKVDPEKFPLTLGAALQQGQMFAYTDITSGQKDGVEVEDDKINAGGASIAVSELSPSQSSMNIGKACNFAIAAILEVKPFPSGPGGDLGAIISSDNHIMDGHHRWIASGMVDPTSSVGGYQVEFPAKQLIAVLNKITVGLGVKSGKEGTGGFGQFTASGVKNQLQAFLDNPSDCWAAGGDRDKIVEALKTFSGEAEETAALNATAKKMGENLGTLTLKGRGGFPARPDMPVISKAAGDLAKAIKLLQTGAVDVNPPYADGESMEQDNKESGAADKADSAAKAGFKRAKGKKEKQMSLPFGESKVSQEDLILERWHQLAGLLK